MFVFLDPVLCWQQFSAARVQCWPARCVGTGDLADPRRQPASAAPDACTAYSALAGVGSVLGVALGLASSAAVLSAGALASASAVSLLTSALLGAVCGFLATGIALYAAGRRAINRQISDERAQLASHRPVWSLLGIDFLILAAVAAVEWYQRRHGGFEGVRGSVYYGRAVSLRLHLVIVPIGVWLGGVCYWAESSSASLPTCRCLAMSVWPATWRPLDAQYPAPALGPEPPR